MARQIVETQSDKIVDIDTADLDTIVAPAQQTIGANSSEEEWKRGLANAPFRFKGYIERTEHRAMTVKQLKVTIGFCLAHCHLWSTQPPEEPGKPIAPQKCNLYHVNNWLIMPLTREKNCAFVELLVGHPQIPDWFISHWWGEAIHHFMECVLLHMTLRANAPNYAYWICAYANRQWSVAGELGSDPSQSSFYKAMLLSAFRVLLILNAGSGYAKEAVALTRIWCIFEETEAQKQLISLLDIAAFSERAEACIMTDGFTEADVQNDEKGIREMIRRGREANFPLTVIDAALEIKVQHAQATSRDDRKHILNYIIGLKGDDLENEPPEEHEEFDKATVKLRGAFAQRLWRRALAGAEAEDNAETKQKKKDLLMLLGAALAVSGLAVVCIDLSGLRPSVEDLELIAKSLPSEAKQIELGLSDTGLSDDKFSAVLSHVPGAVEKINIDLGRNPLISSRVCGKMTELNGVAIMANLSGTSVSLEDRTNFALQGIVNSSTGENSSGPTDALLRMCEWPRADHTLVKELVNKSADINAVGTSMSPLARACQDSSGQNTNMVGALMNAGASLNPPGNPEVSPLCMAVTSGNAALARDFVAKGAEPNTVNALDSTFQMGWQSKSTAGNRLSQGSVGSVEVSGVVGGVTASTNVGTGEQNESTCPQLCNCCGCFGSSSSA